MLNKELLAIKSTMKAFLTVDATIILNPKYNAGTVVMVDGREVKIAVGVQSTFSTLEVKSISITCAVVTYENINKDPSHPSSWVIIDKSKDAYIKIKGV